MKFLLSLAIATTLMTTSAFATTACKEYVTVTPDNAPVTRTGVSGTGTGPSPNYTGVPGQFGCPIKAAPGTCIAANRSLADPVGSHAYQFVTLDGEVPDITQHRKGLQIGPVFIPLTGYRPGSC